MPRPIRFSLIKNDDNTYEPIEDPDGQWIFDPEKRIRAQNFWTITELLKTIVVKREENEVSVLPVE